MTIPKPSTSPHFTIRVAADYSQNLTSAEVTNAFPGLTLKPKVLTGGGRYRDDKRTIVIAVLVPVLVVALVTVLALTWVYVLSARWNRHRRVDVEAQPVCNKLEKVFPNFTVKICN